MIMEVAMSWAILSVSLFANIGMGLSLYVVNSESFMQFVRAAESLEGSREDIRLAIGTFDSAVNRVERVVSKVELGVGKVQVSIDKVQESTDRMEKLIVF